MTILLVLVAAVTLLIGIFSDQLPLIFISIGASALAAIVLAVLSQMSRRKGRAPEAAADDEKAPATVSEGSPVPAEPAARGESDAEAPTEVVPVASAASGGGGTAELAIAGYDTLRVNEILPKLQDLGLEELEGIAQHEESHKNRTTVLNRIDQLMDGLEAEETGASAAASSPSSSAPVSDEVAEEVAASIEEIGEPVVALDAGADDAGADDGFPIPGYEGMTEAELIPLLESLDADELEQVADREEAGPNRDAVLDAIDDRLDILEGIVPAPVPATVPSRKAASKRAPAKKSTAKRAAAAPVPSRKAAATKKAAAAPARKAAGSRAASATKAAKKVAKPAKKAPTATAAKKAVAKKSATARKATPVKKAGAAKKATRR
ncbi:MAG TPA: hypothetical protein VM933_06655 [Acidimicrobiales bacterium]|nr:hypothetical protein [Acidimicrobiales bacterium]